MNYLDSTQVDAQMQSSESIKLEAQLDTDPIVIAQVTVPTFMESNVQKGQIDPTSTQGINTGKGSKNKRVSKQT